MRSQSVREINWDYVGDAVPAFLTLLIIPLTYKYVFRFTDVASFDQVDAALHMASSQVFPHTLS
jgi:xanthine/uracil/vitamin C permease (AzgA family)